MASKPTLPYRMYIIRHGDTDSNSGASGGEKFRGWANIPLNSDGIEAAHTAGTKLSSSGVSQVFSSDLNRAQHTASIISQYTSAEVIPTYGARPWNIGNFSGQPVEGNEEMFNHYHNSPNEPTPGGESYNTFYSRWKTTLHHLMHHTASSGTPLALVTHSRNVNALKSILTNGKASIKAESLVDPGSVLSLDFNSSGEHKISEL